MNVVRLQACHSKVGNSPRIVSVLGDIAIHGARIFYGEDDPEPEGMTLPGLPFGDSNYNGYGSGYIVNAQLTDGGSGYAVGDELIQGDGTTGALYNIRWIVEAVDATGKILDCRVSKVGVYDGDTGDAYPANPVSTTHVTGTGTGAKFNLNFPNADLYINIADPENPVLYICTLGGTNTSAVWAKISGGGGGGTTRFKISVGGMHDDYMVCESMDGVTTGITVAKASKLRHVSSEDIAGTTYSYSYGSDSGYLDGNRTASNSGDTEKQVVIPVYLEGDEIVCTKPSNGTGVVDDSDHDVLWQDLNVDGRAWARKWDQS